MGKALKQDNPGRGASAGVSTQLVKELAARIRQYGSKNEITDIDEVEDYLKKTNPAYKRRPQLQFRRVVEQAVLRVQQLDTAAKPELQLQVFEENHAGGRDRGQGKEPQVTSDKDALPEDSSDAELEKEADGDKDFEEALTLNDSQGMNSTLATLYGTPIASQAGGLAALLPNSQAGPALPEAETRAFAAPHLVAAAAARALAAEKQAQKEAQQSKAPAAEPSAATPILPSSLSFTRNNLKEPATAVLPPTAETPAFRRLQRHLSKDGSRTTGKRARPHLDAEPRTSSSVIKPQAVRYADLGGIDGVLKDILELVQWPLMHPEIYSWLGVEPPRGVLLHGPPGCGKTALANAIANECDVPFLRISAPEIVSGMSGESEAKLRQLFQEAASQAPCIIFIDEIDAIAGKRESAQREMERRIVAQMLTCMDDLAAPRPPKVAKLSEAAAKLQSDRHVLVIGATNRPDSLDTALRRAGRFDREIAMGIPNQAARVRILQVIVQKLRLSGDFDFHAIAAKTPGFVGADLQALTKEAAAIAIARIFSCLHQSQGLSPHVAVNSQGDTASKQLGGGPLSQEDLAGLAITMLDFEAAVGKVQPSVRREGFATTPDVTWEDVGALKEVREELAFAITHPIKHPQQFAAMGLDSPSGVLLFGPPGCGKTLLAKAVANESGANFISIKGPELLNKFVGESERAVRQVFARARAASPCVLFFDEMDALAPRRGTDSNSSSERVVNQLLTEMDGIDGRQGVYMIAATNRPDIIDRALLRPGRLDKMLYIPLPAPEERAEIAAALTRSKPLAEGVDVRAIASQYCHGFSGADLNALVREAATNALKASMTQPFASAADTPSPKIEGHHFQTALAQIKPSVSPKDQRIYDSLRLRLPAARAHLDRAEGTDTAQPIPGLEAAALSQPGSAAEMDRSNGDGTAGSEPMDE